MGQRIAANTGLLISARVLGVSFGIITLIIAARHLSPVEFGTLAFLHAYMLFFGEVTTFKTWQSIIKFGSDDLEHDDANSLSRLLKFSIKLDIISVIIAYGLSLALMGLFVGLAADHPDLMKAGDMDALAVQRYAALYCLVLLLRQTGTSSGVLRLFDRFGLIALRTLIMPATRLAGALFVAARGGGFEGFLLVWFLASALSYGAEIIMGASVLYGRRLLKMAVTAKQDFLRPRAGLWPFVIKSNIDSSLSGAAANLPQLLVTLTFGASWNGVYKVAEEVSKLLSQGFKLLDQVIYPELAKLVSRREAAQIWALVMRAAVIMLGVSLVFGALLIIAGPELLSRLFGEAYIEAAPLATLLIIAAALLALVTPLYPVFYALNMPERAVYVRAARLAVYIASFFVLSHIIGKMAPGWAAIVANLFAALILVFYTRISLTRYIAKDAIQHRAASKPDTQA